MNKETLSIIIRALLQAVAGALTARGVTVDNGTVEVVAGAAVAIGTIIWSQSAKNKIREQGATQTITKP